MTQDEAVIQAVQNAIDGALPGEDAKEAIRAYLSALDKAGFAVTLKEADANMLNAKDGVCVSVDEMGVEIDLTDFAAANVWRAMVSASPPPPGADK